MLRRLALVSCATGINQRGTPMPLRMVALQKNETRVYAVRFVMSGGGRKLLARSNLQATPQTPKEQPWT